MTTSRISNDFGDFGDVEVIDESFGDRKRHGRKHKKHSRGYYGLFGNATKRKLKRPYKRTVVRQGRKLIGKKKIGSVEKTPGRGKFAWVTRRGSVYEATVSKKTAKKPAKKAAKKTAKKSARKAAKKK